MNKNDYAPIAPMGWNSYDYYDTTVNEEQVRANAAYLAEHLKDAGYEYVVVDIEWYAKKAGSQRNFSPRHAVSRGFFLSRIYRVCGLT